MDITECISELAARGYLVEADDRQDREDHWLVFSPLDAREAENGWWPDFFDTPGLIQWFDRYQMYL